MDTENVWGKIRKTVVDGVTIAAEKTEEYTRMGKAKLDVLTVKRNITKLQTDLGAHIYQAVQEGKSEGVFESEAVKGMISGLRGLETELGQKEAVYQDFRGRVQADVEEVKKKAKSGMDEIKSKTKAQVNRMKKKAESESETPSESSEPPREITVE